MSKSQLKRLHELNELEKYNNEGDDIEPVVQRKGPANRFAFLDDEDEEECGSADKNDDVVEEPINTEKNKKKNQKKKNKKNKKKEKKGDFEDDESDEQLLKRLAEENKKYTGDNGDGKLGATCIQNILKVDPKLFDPSEELKRKLGKTFREASSSGAPQNNRNPHFRAIGRIIKSRRTWPLVKNDGLSMVFDKEKDDIKWFRFAHNSFYESLDKMSYMSERSTDLGQIQAIIYEHPYHLNSLIVLANMMRMQGDVTQANDMIERGIFYCEQMFAAQFEPFSMNHCIDYNVYENRALFLLLHRHMLNAMNKRCFESALNVAKFIFKLDTKADHMGIMLIIDTIAIKARQYSWFIDMYEALKEWKNLKFLPNMRYSLALAKFLNNQYDEATEELKEAIKHYSTVIPALLDEMQVHPDSLIINHEHLSDFALKKERESLQSIIKIYVKQSSELWKEPTTLAWLEEVTRQVASDKSLNKMMAETKEKRLKQFAGKSCTVCRVEILLEMRSCQSITDPMPPVDGINSYARDVMPTPRSSNGQQEGTLASFMSSMFPDYDPENPMDLLGRLENLFRRVQINDGGNEVQIEREDPNEPE